eukprot:ANDGO_03485.mRNA.1 hypothetical protein
MFVPPPHSLSQLASRAKRLPHASAAVTDYSQSHEGSILLAANAFNPSHLAHSLYSYAGTGLQARKDLSGGGGGEAGSGIDVEQDDRLAPVGPRGGTSEPLFFEDLDTMLEHHRKSMAQEVMSAQRAYVSSLISKELATRMEDDLFKNRNQILMEMTRFGQPSVSLSHPAPQQAEQNGFAQAIRSPIANRISGTPASSSQDSGFGPVLQSAPDSRALAYARALASFGNTHSLTTLTSASASPGMRIECAKVLTQTAKQVVEDTPGRTAHAQELFQIAALVAEHIRYPSATASANPDTVMDVLFKHVATLLDTTSAAPVFADSGDALIHVFQLLVRGRDEDARAFVSRCPDADLAAIMNAMTQRSVDGNSKDSMLLESAKRLSRTAMPRKVGCVPGALACIMLRSRLHNSVSEISSVFYGSKPGASQDWDWSSLEEYMAVHTRSLSHAEWVSHVSSLPVDTAHPLTYARLVLSSADFSLIQQRFRELVARCLPFRTELVHALMLAGLLDAESALLHSISSRLGDDAALLYSSCIADRADRVKSLSQGFVVSATSAGINVVRQRVGMVSKWVEIGDLREAVAQSTRALLASSSTSFPASALGDEGFGVLAAACELALSAGVWMESETILSMMAEWVLSRAANVVLAAAHVSFSNAARDFSFSSLSPLAATVVRFFGSLSHESSNSLASPAKPGVTNAMAYSSLGMLVSIVDYVANSRDIAAVVDWLPFQSASQAYSYGNELKGEVDRVLYRVNTADQSVVRFIGLVWVVAMIRDLPQTSGPRTSDHQLLIEECATRSAETIPMEWVAAVVRARVCAQQ